MSFAYYLPKFYYFIKYILNGKLTYVVGDHKKEVCIFLKNPDAWRHLYNDSEQSKDASHARISNLAVNRIILGAIIPSAI